VTRAVVVPKETLATMPSRAAIVRPKGVFPQPGSYRRGRPSSTFSRNATDVTDYGTIQRTGLVNWTSLCPVDIVSTVATAKLGRNRAAKSGGQSDDDYYCEHRP